MLELYKNIKRLREEKGMSQDTLAKLTGYTDRSSITKIEKGQVDLQQSKIELFAKALGTTARELVGWENKPLTEKKKTGVIINVLGSVAAGIPISAVEDIIDEEEVTEDMARQGNLFGLRIKGHSMEPNICDGVTVIVKEQPDAENGEFSSMGMRLPAKKYISMRMGVFVWYPTIQHSPPNYIHWMKSVHYQ